MVTTLLLKQLTIFFIYMASGFMMVKLGILKGEDSKVLSLLCIYVLLPCAILKSYQAEYTPELRDGFMLAMGAAVTAQLVLMAVTYGISGICHLDATEKASIMYPNSANLILPLVAGTGYFYLDPLYVHDEGQPGHELEESLSEHQPHHRGGGYHHVFRANSSAKVGAGHPGRILGRFGTNQYDCNRNAFI